jgi:IS605 OrfB family transposase
MERSAKDIHGEYEKVREPVDFVVLEDLNRYLTSQGRSKMENSRLMKWCHRAILGKLKELCETYGIPVLETAAAYSSKFSAKDGMPGFRAKEVTWADRGKYPWKKMLERNEPVAVRLFESLRDISKDQNPAKPRKLLAPVAGGPIFVPMVGSETQADINAAVNLGLRAVAAPDVLQIHHKIRTESDGDGVLRPLTRSKREIARWGKQPGSFIFAGEVKLDRNSNCFPLAGFLADFENCTLNGRQFATGKGLWGTIKQRQWERVRQLNEQRMRKNGWAEVDDIPM